MAEVLSADPQYTSLGNKEFDSYYQSFLKTLPTEEIEYHPIEYEAQTVEGIRDQVAGYMRNYYDKAIKQRQTQTSQYNAAADVDAASRGMLPSTYLSDLKGRQYMAEAADIANLESDYNANLAQTTADQYNQYLNRRLQVDTQNVANQMDVDKWNAQARLALEELAYNRGMNAWQLSQQGQGGGGGGYSGGGGGGSHKPPYDPATYQQALGVLTQKDGYTKRAAVDYLLAGDKLTPNEKVSAVKAAQDAARPSVLAAAKDALAAQGTKAKTAGGGGKNTDYNAYK